MKHGLWKRLGTGAVALACALMLIHCGSNGTSGENGANNLSEASNSISISPTIANIASGRATQFNATVGGSPSNAVTWSVRPASGSGSVTQIATISSTGTLHAATNAPATVLLVSAASTADPTSIASATVTIIPPGSVATTNNPLVAKYTISVPRQATATIQFGPDTNYGLKTWAQPTPSGGGPVSIFVAGMKQDSVYHMSAFVQFSDGSSFNDEDHSFTTGGVPANMPVPNFTITNPNGQTPSSGVELIDGVEAPNYTEVGATDLEGNLIWYFAPPTQYPGDIVNPIKLLPNGNFLVVFSNPVGLPPSSAGATLEEVDLAGDVIWQLPIAQFNQELTAAGYNFQAYTFNHDVLPLSNGHIIVLVDTTQTFNDLPGYPGPTVVLGDVLVDLDQNLQPVWYWNEFDHLDINRHPWMFPDWTHTNAVIYSPSDGDLIVSMRHQNWIVKVDYDNGQGDGHIVWRLGEGGDFKLVGGTDPNDWFYAQHGISLLGSNSTGRYELGMFDNGNDRILNKYGYLCGVPGAPACYSTVPIFRIDESAKTATIVWRDTLPILSFFGGNMQLLPNGNVEFDAAAWGATEARVMEVTEQSQPRTVWEMDESPSLFYRAFRIPSLYPGVTW